MTPVPSVLRTRGTYYGVLYNIDQYHQVRLLSVVSSNTNVYYQVHIQYRVYAVYYFIPPLLDQRYPTIEGLKHSSEHILHAKNLLETTSYCVRIPFSVIWPHPAYLCLFAFICLQYHRVASIIAAVNNYLAQTRLRRHILKNYISRKEHENRIKPNDFNIHRLAMA